MPSYSQLGVAHITDANLSGCHCHRDQLGIENAISSTNRVLSVFQSQRRLQGLRKQNQWPLDLEALVALPEFFSELPGQSRRHWKLAYRSRNPI